MTLTRRLGGGLAGAALLGLMWTAPAAPQAGAELQEMRKELEALKQGQAAILKELQELRTLIQGPRPRAGAGASRTDTVLNLGAARFLGDPRAPVTLVEFSDYQCPFCARHLRETVPQIDRDYIKTGKVKYVVRDFPLTRIHPQAFKGHEAARCAGDQDKFWEMHGHLFARQSAMAPSDLEGHAQALGLDLPKFRECLASGKHAAGIQQDLEEGEKAGITGTPNFMLGLTDLKEPRFRASRTLVGAQPYERFKEAIEALLEQTSSRPK